MSPGLWRIPSNRPARRVHFDSRSSRCPSLLVLVVLVACWPLRPAQADDAAEREVARRLFAEGVAAAASQHWEVAADIFEESLRHAEHPATRFNLVLTSAELHRPLDVLRNAAVFLDLPETDSRPETRLRVRELMTEATRALAVLDIAMQPKSAELSVDGRPPEVLYGGRIYLLPGLHVLATRKPGKAPTQVEQLLEAGQSVAWPELREGRVSPEPSSLPASAQQAGAHAAAKASVQEVATTRSERRRFRTAWAIGGLAAVSGAASVALYAATKVLGEELARKGAAAAGYPSSADRYRTLQYTVAPLALTSGVLMAGAIALGPRLTRGVSLGWGVGGIASGIALAGLSAVWLAREPQPLVAHTPVQRPYVQAGCLWLGASLPLLSYGLILLIERARGRPLPVQSLLPLKVSW